MNYLITQTEFIDVVIPRGGQELIEYLREKSKIPIFSHLSGLCHTYMHKDCHLDQAIQVLCNAKMRRTGIRGATETLLLDECIASQALPQVVSALEALGCEIRGDEKSQSICPSITKATDIDWATEYLAPILSVRIVSGLDQAVEHIKHYASDHTEAILTENKSVAEEFIRRVESSIVMHNASTQFADGGEFGLGAEIGIATGKLHARGPVGVEQLTTFKYEVRGQNQIRP